MDITLLLRDFVKKFTEYLDGYIPFTDFVLLEQRKLEQGQHSVGVAIMIN